MADNATNIPPLKRELLTESIPPTACTPSLLKALQAYAKAEKVSGAAVVRRAVALFLSRDYEKSVDIPTNPLEEEASSE